MSDDSHVDLELKEGAPRPTFHVTWTTPTEKLDANVTHALLVIPGEKGQYATYFGIRTTMQLAEMTASVMGMAARRGNAEALLAAFELFEDMKDQSMRTSRIIRPPGFPPE